MMPGQSTLVTTGEFHFQEHIFDIGNTSPIMIPLSIKVAAIDQKYHEATDHHHYRLYR